MISHFAIYTKIERKQVYHIFYFISFKIVLQEVFFFCIVIFNNLNFNVQHISLKKSSIKSEMLSLPGLLSMLSDILPYEAPDIVTHHASIPETLISPFHHCNVLVKPLPMLLAYITHILNEIK